MTILFLFFNYYIIIVFFKKIIIIKIYFFPIIASVIMDFSSVICICIIISNVGFCIAQIKIFNVQLLIMGFCRNVQ